MSKSEECEASHLLTVTLNKSLTTLHLKSLFCKQIDSDHLTLFIGALDETWTRCLPSSDSISTSCDYFITLASQWWQKIPGPCPRGGGGKTGRRGSGRRRQEHESWLKLGRRARHTQCRVGPAGGPCVSTHPFSTLRASRVTFPVSWVSSLSHSPQRTFPPPLTSTESSCQATGNTEIFDQAIIWIADHHPTPLCVLYYFCNLYPSKGHYLSKLYDSFLHAPCPHSTSDPNSSSVV